MNNFAASIPSDVSLDNATVWYNLTSWTVNVTRYAPSLENIVWAGPRMFQKLGTFLSLPEQVDSHSDHQQLANAVADGSTLQHLTADSNLYNIMEPVAEEAFQRAGAASETVARTPILSVEGVRGFGSVFSYATSKWALACIAMAILLNRTHIYAATRRRLRLRWTVRLLLRCLPIVLISTQVVRLLQSIQCQTSPNFAELRWGDESKKSELMFSYHNAFFNTLAATILRSTDEQSCLAVSMIPLPDDGSTHNLRGSLSRLWPLFGSFCLSHFIETLSCAVQGRPHAYETAMTLFEQSLAFAEADAAVSNQLTWGKISKSSSSAGIASVSGNSIAITRSMIMRRVNTPPEVMFVALLSSLTHISSHILGVFDIQARYRLFNTGLWACCFMATLVWSAVVFDLDEPASQGLLRFPTVCIISLIPHILVLMGIFMCLIIYGFGLFLSALSPPAEEEHLPLTFRQRLARAHHNMQANVSLSEIRITREMDIYTALLRTGFAAVTMASEAVYLNEDRGVGLKSRTWLEEARLQEAEELQKTWAGISMASRYDQIGAIGLIPVQGGTTSAASGYSRERAAQQVPNSRADRGLRVGVGASERSARWVMAVELFANITRLFSRLGAIVFIWLLGIARIRARPAWLLHLARRSKPDQQGQPKAHSSATTPALASGDAASASVMDALDIEAEIRRTTQLQGEDSLDADLYSYWLHGGWWGSKDSSGDYLPTHAEADWDTTSVVSATTAGGQTDDESGWESEEDGQRTPTQRSPRDSRAGTPAMDSPFSMNDLAQLLQPKSPEQQGHARALAAHFQSDGIVTRSQFRRMEQLQRTRILTSAGSHPHSLHKNINGVPARNAKMTPEDEERMLEQLLLSRRQAAQSEKLGSSEVKGDGAFISDGPHCVVCQSSPRSIIVWPCRCLSLCDDCRVSLAMNNFDKCVCCRREVMSFSRIFVP